MSGGFGTVSSGASSVSGGAASVVSGSGKVSNGSGIVSGGSGTVSGGAGIVVGGAGIISGGWGSVAAGGDGASVVVVVVEVVVVVLVEVEVEPEPRCVPDQLVAVAIEDLAAQRRHADRLEALGQLRRAVAVRREDLEPPELRREPEESGQHGPCDDAQVAVSFVELVEDEHVRNGWGTMGSVRRDARGMRG